MDAGARRTRLVAGLVVAGAIVGGALLVWLPRDRGVARGPDRRAARPPTARLAVGGASALDEGARDQIAPTAQGHLLSGQVLDSEAGPIEGARVQAMGTDTPEIPDAGAPLSTTSASDGTYRLPLAAAEYQIVVSADGYLPVEQSLTLAGDVSRDFRLAPAARIVGRVLERADRRPVVGAAVWLVPRDRQVVRPPEVSSGPDGSFSFSTLAGGTYFVRAEKQALRGQSAEVALQAPGAATGVEVLVARGHSLAGRALGEDGRPAVGALVRLEGESARQDPIGREAVVGADGAYRFEGLASGLYRLQASAEGAVEVVRDVRVTSDRDGVDLVLARAGALVGQVVTESGAPVDRAQVLVEVIAPERRDRRRATSGPRGAFAVRPLPAARLLVEARDRDGGFAALDPVALASGETKQVTIRIARGASIEGAVHHEDGRPCDGMPVIARVDRPGAPLEHWRDFSGADGRYRLGPLPPGRAIVIAGRGFEPLWSSADGPQRRTLELRPGGSLRGVDFVVPSGKGVRGVVVGRDGRGIARAEVTLGAEGAAPASTESGADGRFAIPDAGAGPFSLRVRRDGMATVERAGIAGGASELRVLLLPEARIAGVVVRRDGEPVGAGWLSLWPAPAPGSTALALRPVAATVVQDPGGAFVLAGAPVGTYDLHAATSDGSRGATRVRLDEGRTTEPVRVVVAPGAVVRGLVADGDGAPLPGVTVQARLSPYPRSRAVTDRHGRFEIAPATRGEPLRLAFEPDPSTHLASEQTFPLPAAAGAVIDLGTVVLRRRAPAADSNRR